MAEPDITALQVVTLHPGDCLVARVDARLSEPALVALRTRIAAQVGPDVSILILDDGVQLDVLRPDTPRA